MTLVPFLQSTSNFVDNKLRERRKRMERCNLLPLQRIPAPSSRFRSKRRRGSKSEESEEEDDLANNVAVLVMKKLKHGGGEPTEAPK